MPGLTFFVIIPKMNIKYLTNCILVILVFGGAGLADKIRCWQPKDFVFKSSTNHENPFKVNFSAQVKGPENISFTTLGFYDGEKAWKIRIAPYAKGKWSFRTVSDDPALNGKSDSFVCVDNNSQMMHGPIKVDAQHPHTFIYADGKRYFPMGYECDWLWALDMRSFDTPVLNSLLDKVQYHNFNQILMNAYAYDTKWRPGRTGIDDYGPARKCAWEGTNDKPDHGRFNLEYWQHYDKLMWNLYNRGIIATIMIKVYNKNVNWPANGSNEDDMYYRWLIARYAAFPNLIWSLAKESQNEPDVEYKLNRLRMIRSIDPYHRLLTTHDDKAVYDSGKYDDLLDFRSDQQHTNLHQTMLEQREKKNWPVMNVEFGYECGPQGVNDKTYSQAQTGQEVCRRAWEIETAGGGIVYYYTYSAWDVIRPEAAKGCGYFKNLYDFFVKTNYWLMEPADELVSKGYCLAIPGKEYIIFLNKPEPFTLKIEGGGTTFKAEWFEPFTGECLGVEKIKSGINQMIPKKSHINPVMVHIYQAI